VSRPSLSLERVRARTSVSVGSEDESFGDQLSQNLACSAHMSQQEAAPVREAFSYLGFESHQIYLGESFRLPSAACCPWSARLRSSQVFSSATRDSIGPPSLEKELSNLTAKSRQKPYARL